MTVDLDGLTNGQTYYCKTAATNNNSIPYNCTLPGFGGVSEFVTFTTMLSSMKAPVQGNDYQECIQSFNTCVLFFHVHIFIDVVPLPGMLCCCY